MSNFWNKCVSGWIVWLCKMEIENFWTVIRTEDLKAGVIHLHLYHFSINLIKMMFNHQKNYFLTYAYYFVFSPHLNWRWFTISRSFAHVIRMSKRRKREENCIQFGICKVNWNFRSCYYAKYVFGSVMLQLGCFLLINELLSLDWSLCDIFMLILNDFF